MSKEEQDKKTNQVTSAAAKEAIPAKPAELSDKELDKVAGGGEGTVPAYNNRLGGGPGWLGSPEGR